MHDARDEEDRRLLEAGEHAALLRSYYETIIQRCNVRCRTRDEALECAQTVVVRLLSELKRGKRYSVPFRVVVHKVIEWTTKGFYAGGGVVPGELREDLPVDGNPIADAETRYDLERALAALPEGDGEVASLRLLEGIEIDEIAERLGKTRNAVDQALHRSRKKLQDLFA
jgi:DNA-directed RNA polymerase specialized sigma24 family protein